MNKIVIISSLIIILIGLIIYLNNNSNNKISFVETISKAQECLIDDDCVLIFTRCDSCGCGKPVNKKYEKEYKDKFFETCKNYKGAICDSCCNTPYIRCINNICTISNISREGIEATPC